MLTSILNATIALTTLLKWSGKTEITFGTLNRTIKVDASDVLLALVSFTNLLRAGQTIYTQITKNENN